MKKKISLGNYFENDCNCLQNNVENRSDILYFEVATSVCTFLNCSKSQEKKWTKGRISHGACGKNNKPEEIALLQHVWNIKS